MADDNLPAAILATSGLAQFAALIIWGATLSNRVKTIERDIEPLRLLGASVSRMEARLEGLVEQFRDLNATIRWGRKSPLDVSVSPAIPVPGREHS